MAIQYGRSKCKKFVLPRETRYKGVPGVVDYESKIKIQDSKMVVQYTGRKRKKLVDSDGTRYLRVFEVAEYES